MILNRSNIVAFVSGIPRHREKKLALGLKKNGWHVVFLCPQGTDFSTCESHFQVVYFSSVSELFSSIREIEPNIFHVFNHYDYIVSYHLINNIDHIPIILDPYDTIFKMFTDDFLLNHKSHKDSCALEQYCFNKADALCCRSLVTQVYKKDTSLITGKKRILLFDGCLDESGLAQKIVSSKKDLHVVYCGSFMVEKYFPEYKDRGLLSVAKKIITSGMNFHVYPPENSNFNEVFSEYIDYEKDSAGKFRLHRTLPYDSLVSELKNYDLGLFNPYSLENIENTEYLIKYGMANKVFDYIEAGLPIIIDPRAKMTSYYANKYRIGFTLDEILYSGDFELLEKYSSAKKNLKMAAEYFNIYKQTKRLSDFYFDIIAEKRKKLVSNNSNKVLNASCEKDQKQIYHGFPLASEGVYANVGCGECYDIRWLNFDIVSSAPNFIKWDVSNGLPLKNNSTDVVYASYLLEYLPKEIAAFFITEVLRILKNNGILRLVVSDLEQIVRNYLGNLEKVMAKQNEAEYFYELSIKELLQFKPPKLSWVENENCNWMYDRYRVEKLLRDAGFVNMKLFRYDESDIPEFNSYLLDKDKNGLVRKVNSIFIEARK
ncbi:MAG: methyltransferase domain-containing protein [Candidatus Riflebacteria bacterium]|nr:methyltransferase domain-containing protein [Candidatus Riflebacteria bacterium]